MAMLQFKCHSPLQLQIFRNRFSCKFFHELRMAECVADCSITRDAFTQNCFLQIVFFGNKKFFNTAMLVSQMDFEMMNGFPVADKTKMSGLDHSRVNRSYAYFVKLFTIDMEERIIVHAAVAVVTVMRPADRFQPGITGKFYAVVFVHFTLENVHGINRRCERFEICIIMRAYVRKNTDTLFVIIRNGANELPFANSVRQRKISYHMIMLMFQQ